MNIVAIAIACVVLVVGAYVGKKDLSNYAQNMSTNGEATNEVLSTEDDQTTITEEGDASVSVDINNSLEDETLTQIPKVTDTPLLTSVPNSTSELNAYMYVNSELISATDSELHLRSSVDTDMVTNWYKEKVRGDGMNIKTFVTTKANEKILNKLVGANADKEIRVEIKKEPGETFCYIDVYILSKP